MSRSLDDLTTRFRPMAVQLIAYIVEDGIAAMIVDTLRTEAEHLANLKAGTSGTALSKHLPLRLRWPGGTLPADLVPNDRDRSDAIDLAPFEQYQLHGPDKLKWDATDPVWLRMGEIGERLGLRWGGRWEKPRDPGHFEWFDHDDPARVKLVADERARPYPARQV